MKKIAKTLSTLAMCSALAASITAAHAITIDFTYQVPNDNSGKTSPYAVDINNVAKPGYFIETFDTGENTFTNTSTINVSGPCGFTSVDPTTDIIVTSGSLGVRQGSVTGVAASPANDTTCFAFGPGPAPRLDGNSAKVRIDYAAFLAALPAPRANIP